jgi:hypothetical protein
LFVQLPLVVDTAMASVRVKSKVFVPDKGDQRIKALQRQVRQLKKSDEVKFHDFASGITTAAAGTITLLSGIAEGAGSAERIGVQISPSYLVIRDGIIWPTVQAWYRCIIFQDMFTNGAAPAVADVLAAAAWNGSFNHLNETNGRIRVLMDYTMQGVPATDSAIQSHIAFKRKIAAIKFVGATAAQASCGAGSIYALRITSAGATQPTSDLRLELQYRG